MLAIVVGGIAQQNDEEAPVVLELKMKEGDQFTQKMDMSMQVSGGGMPDQMTFKAEAFLTQIVSQVSEDGLFSLLNTVRTEITQVMMGNIDMKNEMPEVENLEVLRQKIRKNGNIIETTGISTSALEGSHFGFMSEDSATLPDKPIKIGSGWTKEIHNEMGDLLVTNTLVGFEKQKGYNCAKIKGEVIGTLNQDNIDSTIEKGEHLFYFAVNEGVTVSQSLTMKTQLAMPTGEQGTLELSLQKELQDIKHLAPEKLQEVVGSIEMIETGLNHLQGREYDKAKGEFQKFLSTYKESPWHSDVEKLSKKVETGELAAEYRESVIEEIEVNDIQEARRKALDSPLKSLDGKTIKISDFKGKVVILNFWATWLPACVREMTALGELYNKHKDDLVVLGISVDSSGEEVVRTYIQKSNITYPIIMSTKAILDAFEPVVEEPIDTIPTTIIIDRKGFILKKYVGAQKKEILGQAYESAAAHSQPEAATQQMKGTGAIEGMVIDTSPDRNPVGNAYVIYIGTGIDNRGEVITDEDGNYKITGLRPGQYVIHVTKKGYAPRTEIPATVIAGAETILEIKLLRKIED